MNKILAGTHRREFTAEQFNEFVELLRDIDMRTVRVPIREAVDVALTEEGKTVKGEFAFSMLAMQQLCGYISKGLWTLVADIAGVYPSTRSFESTLSVPLAAQIINRCAALRFRARDGLMDRDMIQNHQTRTIDGIVGPRYCLLPNHQLLEAVTEMAAGHDTPMQFYSGMLIDRRMIAVFRTAAPLVSIPDGDVYGGAYFVNSEAGECAVHGATLLHVGPRLRCLNKIKQLRHFGNDFLKRLHTMLAATMQTWDNTVATAQTAADTLATPIKLVTPDGKLSKAARVKLKSMFSNYVESPVASEAVRRVIFMGADGTEVPRRTPAAEIAKRRVRDIVITAMKLADGNYPDVRESLERAAFDVLAGKTKLGAIING